MLLVACSPCQGRADLIDGPPSLRNRLMRHLPAIGILAAEARAGGGSPRASGSLVRGPSPVLGGDPLHLPGSALARDGGLCPGCLPDGPVGGPQCLGVTMTHWINEALAQGGTLRPWGWRAQEVGVTGIPEQSPGREHPGCWPQCKPDLLTPPECGAGRGQVWPGAPSLLSPHGHSRCGRSPAGPLPPTWPAAQPLFAASPGFCRFLAGFWVETEMQLLRLALHLGAGSPTLGCPVSSVSHEGWFLGKRVACAARASWAWGEGGPGEGEGPFSAGGLCGPAVFASSHCTSSLGIGPGLLTPSILRHNKVKIKWHRKIRRNLPCSPE